MILDCDICSDLLLQDPSADPSQQEAKQRYKWDYWILVLHLIIFNHLFCCWENHPQRNWNGSKVWCRCGSHAHTAWALLGWEGTMRKQQQLIFPWHLCEFSDLLSCSGAAGCSGEHHPCHCHLLLEGRALGSSGLVGVYDPSLAGWQNSSQTGAFSQWWAWVGFGWYCSGKCLSQLIGFFWDTIPLKKLKQNYFSGSSVGEQCSVFVLRGKL